MALCGDTHKGFDIYQAAGRFADRLADCPEARSNRVVENARKVGGLSTSFRPCFREKQAFPISNNKAAPPYSRVNFSTSSAPKIVLQQLFCEP